MRPPEPVLVIQTAFLGDVVLTLPLVRALRQAAPGIAVDMVAAPRAAPVLEHDPDLRRTIVYDKHGADAGFAGFRRMLDRLAPGGYRSALIPHRSLRSALLAAAARIPVRIGFAAGPGRFLHTATVPYDRTLHEIRRNLALLSAVGAAPARPPAVGLSPGPAREREVAEFLAGAGLDRPGRGIVAIAPGSAWPTKRWPADRFAVVASGLAARGYAVVVVGGPEDRPAGSVAAGSSAVNACGRLTIPGSAELIRRSALLICNDSAPLHLATGVGTPVIALFGPTVPAYGFGPVGPADRVLEADGLWCRPCAPHGGNRCPVGSFDCMLGITPPMVLAAAEAALASGSGR